MNATDETTKKNLEEVAVSAALSFIIIDAGLKAAIKKLMAAKDSGFEPAALLEVATELETVSALTADIAKGIKEDVA